MIRKVTNYQPIYAFGVQCGYLQTIQSEGFKAVELEYHLEKKYRNQGIMSNYLPVYLQELKRKGFPHVTAYVKKSNYASKKLLKRNGFIKFGKVRDMEMFLVSMTLTINKKSIKEYAHSSNISRRNQQFG